MLLAIRVWSLIIILIQGKRLRTTLPCRNKTKMILKICLIIIKKTIVFSMGMINPIKTATVKIKLFNPPRIRVFIKEKVS